MYKLIEIQYFSLYIIFRILNYANNHLPCHFSTILYYLIYIINTVKSHNIFIFNEKCDFIYINNISISVSPKTSGYQLVLLNFCTAFFAADEY